MTTDGRPYKITVKLLILNLQRGKRKVLFSSFRFLIGEKQKKLLERRGNQCKIVLKSDFLKKSDIFIVKQKARTFTKLFSYIFVSMSVKQEANKDYLNIFSCFPEKVLDKITKIM